ncbi:hypothetical protein BU24DRAFT_424940 [Aaosphaeria arxii CBS 175.79]|uniref:DNA excision repair protein n=1 Tax=Aaosphaeria arxii CBS 175.79 TaxID=1450172 RepID=A0A6A5XL99_9PLEO|nr:uncharacterized protein BU24DRAFT_424940 [Aaosphaeria arxii CBS 175.79]KAF2013922.1 hypothetical protein BU24DRAFT_424940 [Aaosphaeria arxii CBS 175.79]
MSFRSRHEQSDSKTRRILAEDESSSDDDLDIVGTARKGLNISQYIDALASQSQPQPSRKNSLRKNDGDSDNAPRSSPPPCSPKREDGRAGNNGSRSVPFVIDSETDVEIDEDAGSASNDPGQESDIDLLGEDPEATYRQYQESKKLKRKRVAAETKRIRTSKKSRAAAATSVVGRKPRKKLEINPHKNDTIRDVLDSYRAASDSEQEETYLDDPIPEYIESRKRKMKKLHEAGLRYPPSYDGIYFSDSDGEQKPVLDKAVKPQRPKKSIQLTESGGIIPAPIARWLRDYQIDGVRFLHERFVRQTGALLGDDMGLGKTIQVIAFLTAAFGKTATSRDKKRLRKMRRAADVPWYPRILIVCPGTLMHNWQDEMDRWGWWIVDKYHGPPAERRGVLNAARKGMCEVMITTYVTYQKNEGEINTVDWDCVIADECHQIKNKHAAVTKAMNKINALCRIGLTGTAIQNKYEELWNLLNWVRPGEYGSYQQWKHSISVPLKVGQAHDATNAQLADARGKAQELVTKILPDVFLRRMKTLIADQLPKKSDRVVFCQLTDTQANAYRTFIESERVDAIRRAKEPCECESGKSRGWCCHVTVSGGGKWINYMFPSMMTLQKLANHLALLLPHTSDLAEKQAKDLDNLQICCPDEWKYYFRMRDKIFDQSQREFCGKWKVLKRLLGFWQVNGDKVLIFSHSVRLLRLLKTLFDVDGHNYNWSYLDGSMKLEDRAKAVADFNSDEKQFVFLISTKAGGVGLNITSANKVVVVDPNWNPAYDLQAQDRAYRIGQTRDVEVFRLVSSGTIEEIMYARQIYKQQQANIGYTASEERRYFKGVMDHSGKVGELFGLQNLFSFEENGLLLRDIVHKTNVAETRAGVNAIGFTPEADSDLDDEEEESILSDKSLGITDDDGISEKQMKKFADRLVNGSDTADTTTKKTTARRKGLDAVNAILAKAGVQYTHENSEVIGHSKIEAELGKIAKEHRNDVDLAQRRVFQSQSQNPASHLSAHSDGNDEDSEDDANEDDHDHDDNADVSFIGSTSKGGRPEYKINYKYRPDERIRRRQLCSMAEMMGFSDPVEFALLVENCTQEERRRMLEKFYRGRRRELWGELT